MTIPFDPNSPTADDIGRRIPGTRSLANHPDFTAVRDEADIHSAYFRHQHVVRGHTPEVGLVLTVAYIQSLSVRQFKTEIVMPPEPPDPDAEWKP